MAISLKSTVAAPVAAYPALKASIVLFDCKPGTRSWTVPEGVSKIRAFVVGGGGYSNTRGGGYSEKLINVTPGQVFSYTVGGPGVAAAITGGTSSFGGLISATGGGGSASGAGTGGDVNTSGGAEADGAGGGAGHAYGAGGTLFGNKSPVVDGWKIGLPPGHDGYGRCAIYTGPTNVAYGSFALPGMGGGGSAASTAMNGGIGAGGGASGNGGPGLVGIEVIA